MVDKTLEAFGLTREEMEQANQQAADQMLPVPYDIPGEVGPSKAEKSKLNLSQFIPPNLRQSLSEAGALGYQAADNVIGIDDDYDTSGELLARAIQKDPVNTIKSVATGVVDSVKAAYDDPRGALSNFGNEFANAYEMLSTPMDPTASRDEVGQRLEAATLLSTVVPGVQLAAGGARAVTSAGARAIPSVLDAMPEYDPNTLYSLGGVGSNRPSVSDSSSRVYPYFDEKALEEAANQNDKSREILVEMPIDDFLEAAKKEVSESKLEGTRALVAGGTPFNSIPQLSFKNNGDGTGRVTGHEGRHRAMALREQGETTIPVRLMSEGGTGPSIRWGQQNNPNSPDYVEIIPQSLIAEEGTGSVSMPRLAAEIRPPQAATITPSRNANLENWSENAYFKDAEGLPQQLYHGMSGNLRGQPVEFSGENLEPSYMGTLGPGTYLTRDPSVASDFATGKRGGYTDEKFGGQVIPVYTNVTKVVDDDIINSNKELRTEIADLIEENTDDNYLFNLADKLRGEGDINLSSLFTKTEDGKVRSTGVGSLVSSLLESKGYEGISVVTDKGFHEAVIFPGHGGVEFPRQNIKSSLQGPEGQYSRETNDMRFAEGGLAMERQMNTMMAEGGIKDDGMSRDPISGNEIPAGSLAKEVRDDVDAKLSEGEYVVPADVVRYFGVNYFEKLRQKAKAGLEEMDKDGRIGGDPVGEPMGDMDEALSDEEMFALNEMFKGGFVTSAGYQEGGDVTSGISNQYQLPSSVFSTAPPPAATATPTTLYGPSGDVMVLMLPAEQERYNQLISEGYSTKPIEAPTAGGEDTGSDRDSTPSAIATPEVAGGEGFNPFSLNEEEASTLSDDPLAFGMGALGRNSLVGSRGAGAVGGAAAGPMGLLVGAGLGGLVELQDLAKARAALIVARDKGLTDTEDYKKLEREIEGKQKGLNTITRGLDNLFGDFFSGQSLAESIKASPATIAPLTTQAIPTGSSTPSSTVIPRNVPNLSAAIPAGSTRDEPTSAGIAYDTDASGRKTIVPGTSAAPDRSVRPVARPTKPTSSSPKKETTEEKLKRGGGFAAGGLVQRPKKKPVAKK